MPKRIRTRKTPGMIGGLRAKLAGMRRVNWRAGRRYGVTIINEITLRATFSVFAVYKLFDQLSRAPWTVLELPINYQLVIVII